MKIGYVELVTNFVVFFMIFLYTVFILVMGNYVKIALCHNKSL